MRLTRTSLGLALLASTALTLGGCEQKPEQSEQPIFRSVEECRSTFDMAACDTMLREAQAEHERTSPKFDSLAACENEFDTGKCRMRTTTNANGEPQISYGPALAGFVAGAIGAVATAAIIDRMGRPNVQPRSSPVYESPMDSTRRRCRITPGLPECRFSGGSTTTSYTASNGTTVATSSAGGRVTTQVTRPAGTNWFNSRTTTTPAPNTNARTPVTAPTQGTSPVPKVAPKPWNPPTATQQAPAAPSRPSWSAPTVTQSAPTTTSRGGFGGSAVSRGGFSSGSSGSRGGGGGGS